MNITKEGLKEIIQRRRYEGKKGHLKKGDKKGRGNPGKEDKNKKPDLDYEVFLQ